jgi:hypothetical protein
MISELEAERNRLDQAIVALERLSAVKLRRRGRPPGWLKRQVEQSVREQGLDGPDARQKITGE